MSLFEGRVFYEESDFCRHRYTLLHQLWKGWSRRMYGMNLLWLSYLRIWQGGMSRCFYRIRLIRYWWKPRYCSMNLPQWNKSYFPAGNKGYPFHGNNFSYRNGQNKLNRKLSRSRSILYCLPGYNSLLFAINLCPDSAAGKNSWGLLLLYILYRSKTKTGIVIIL